MNDCTRCHGSGYLYITNGDDDHQCPSCLGTGENLDTIVTYYQKRYSQSYLLTIEQQCDRRDLELMKDKLWYQRGLYDALGYDRHGVSYVVADSDADDFRVQQIRDLVERQRDIEMERIWR